MTATSLVRRERHELHAEALPGSSLSFDYLSCVTDRQRNQTIVVQVQGGRTILATGQCPRGSPGSMILRTTRP